MESAGAMSELNLSSFDEMAPADGVGFMSQFLGSYPYANEQESDPSFGMPPLFWTGDEGMGIDEILSHCSLDMADFSSSYCLPQWNGSNLFIPTSNYESYYTSDANAIHPSNKSSATLDLSMVDELHTSSSIQVSPVNLLQEVFCLNEDMSNDIFGEMNANLSKPALLPNQSSQPKRKMRVQQSDKTLPDNNCSNNTCPSESPTKKSRVSCDVQTNGRNKHSRQKRTSFMAADEEGNSTALNGQSSSSCSSEDDSSASQELSGAAARNLNGKSRAGRGTATDPQSLYARKRRERINERLRILQNLVPNGTKVDISTMLEEAVQYVKFLQLQIKLLSSDDLWMYAPLAYNGMDIGLDLKISEGP